MPITTLDDVDRPTAIRYAGRDADATARIEPILSRKIEVMKLGGIEVLDLSIIPMVERMQRNGMPANKQKLLDLGDFCLAHMREVVDEIEAESGYRMNPNSPPDTRQLLYDICGLTTDRKTPSGKELSTDDKALEALRGEHACVGMVLDYREHSKIRNSFATVLPHTISEDGRIRCTLRVTRVNSGRLAASSPNLLAQPVRSELGRVLRGCFECRPDGDTIFGGWDLDQVEMRYMAHESKDPVLVNLFLSGTDVHKATASKIFGIPIDQVDDNKHRTPAKRIGFGVITGITGKGLNQQLKLNGITNYSDEDCDDLIEEWFGIYRGVKGYMENCRAEARRYGYVRDCWGRIRYLAGIHSPIPWVRGEAERQSHSFKISAGAQGLLKLGMANIWTDVLPKYWREGHVLEPLLQIHDELIFELDEFLAEEIGPEIHSVMCAAGSDWIVPVKSKYHFHKNWGGLK